MPHLRIPGVMTPQRSLESPIGIAAAVSGGTLLAAMVGTFELAERRR